jgi:hypothetical protein
MTRLIQRAKTIILITGAFPASLQAFQESEAREAAFRHVADFGIDAPESLVLDRRGSGIWSFVSGDLSLGVAVDDSGRLRGLRNSLLDDEVTRRPAGAERVIRTREEAETRARALLRRYVTDSDVYSVAEIVGIDERWNDPGRNNFADRVSVRFAARVGDYPGQIGQASCSFDAVTGKCLMFGVGPLLRYVEPTSRLSPEAAVQRMRQIAMNQLPAARAAGDVSLERALESLIEHVSVDGVILGIETGERPVLGSTYGQTLKDTGTARLCWAWGKDGFSLAIDAESGEPVVYRQTKSSAARRAASPSAPASTPKQPSSSSRGAQSPVQPDAALAVVGSLCLAVVVAAAFKFRNRSG